MIYANVTEGSPFDIKRVVLIWNNGTNDKLSEMFRYADRPVQKRHEEDPLKNQSNDPIYGIELGQFPTNTTISYCIKAFDTANNSVISIEKSFSILD